MPAGVKIWDQKMNQGGFLVPTEWVRELIENDQIDLTRSLSFDIVLHPNDDNQSDVGE